MKKKKYLVAVGVCLIFHSFLLAQVDSTVVLPPISADRPDQTESANLVPKGYMQMEFGFGIEDTDPGFIYVYPNSLLKFGVNDNFELRLIAQYITIQDEDESELSGFLPIAVGIKSRLTEQQGVWPKVSFLGHLRIPGVVSDDFESTYLAPDLRLAFQHGISDFFSVSYNIGVIWDGDDPEPFFIYSLSPGFSFKRLGVFMEGYGFLPQRRNQDIQFRVDAGLTFLIGNDFLLDVSVGKGITDNAPESFVSTGFSYRFKL